MAKKQNVPRLLASELEILEMLWRTKSVTIAEARDGLGGDIGYTTVQTRLNRMVKKGIVRRSRTTPAKYSAGITPDEVSGQDLDLLLEKVSGGRVVPLVAHLVKDRGLSSAEIEELKRLIRGAEQERRSTDRKRGE
jgi:predicted transcriptional regulator